VWLLAVTFTAGIQKVWHPDQRIGFLQKAHDLYYTPNADEIKLARVTHDPQVIATLEKSIKANRQQMNNNYLDAFVAIMFLVLVSIIVLISVREWFLLLSRRKLAVLHECEAVWLPDYAVKEPGANLRTATGAAVIALGLAKELSGEAQLERAQQQVCACHADSAAKSPQSIYLETTEQRFNGVRRCC
jgi:carbon starvation protein